MRLTLALACTAAVATSGAAQAVPAFTLGTPNGAIREPFSRVMGVAELTDGRVVIADVRENLLAIGDFKTGTRAQLGRGGSGPNEYQMVAGVARRFGDTLYVFDGPNRRYLRVDGSGKIVSTLSFPGRAREIGSPRGIDGAGNFYWTGDVVGRLPTGGFKRNQRSKIMRWDLVADSTVPVADFTDHAPEMHEHQFHPFAERDGWVIDAKGRIGVVVARDYHLKWIENGKTVFEGPPIPFQALAVNAKERDGFRAEKEAQGPAGGGRATGPATSSGSGTSPAQRRTMLEYYPDAMFPTLMPPFVENGARLSPRGDIWVERSRAPSDRAPRFDVLGTDGKLRATVQFPPSTQLVGLDRNGIYLVRVDDDGLQTLERHTWPAMLR
jgi:hypothetical protein